MILDLDPLNLKKVMLDTLSTKDLFVSGQVKLENLGEYADDSSAGASGGLVTGELYKTSAGDLKIKL